MNIKDIVVFEFFAPLPLKAKQVNPLTQNFLHFLLNDPYFLPKIELIRKKENIPPEGYPTEMIYETFENYFYKIDGLGIGKAAMFQHLLYPYENFYQTDLNKDQERRLSEFYKNLSQNEQSLIKKYFKEIKTEPDSYKKRLSIQKLDKSLDDFIEILNRYNLPDHYCFHFNYLTMFNAFPNLKEKPKLMFLTSKSKNLSGIRFFKTPFAAIFINEQLSKRQLINWVDGSWEYMKKEMADLPQIPHSKSQVLDISKEISDLRLKNGKKFTEISNLLVDKYPEDGRVYDESWVKETYIRYQERLGNFLKRRNKE